MLITKKFTFEAAHRLRHHRGACRNVHGHSYKVEVSLQGVTSKEGPGEGMVLDFGIVTEIMNRLLHEPDKAKRTARFPVPLDHSLFLHEDDPLHFEILKFTEMSAMRLSVLKWEPTAENFAREIGHYLIEALEEKSHRRGMVSMSHVTVWETAKSCATWFYTFGAAEEPIKEQ